MVLASERYDQLSYLIGLDIVSLVYNLANSIICFILNSAAVTGSSRGVRTSQAAIVIMFSVAPSHLKSIHALMQVKINRSTVMRATIDNSQ